MKFISAVSAIVLSIFAYCTAAVADEYKIGNLVVLMFMKLNEQMEAGQMRKVTLKFEKAGELDVEMIVVDMNDLGEETQDHSNHSGHTN